jgi:holo-[acyl-carrier protein] synthase
MKILGIGVDVIQNKRVRNLTSNKSFIKRTFGKKEIVLLKKNLNKTNFMAKRFAAKEAFAKTIGTGFRYNLNFKDIEILNDKIGKPFFYKSKKINEIINKRFKIKKYNLFLSISDEKDYSVAFTILQVKK